MLRRMGSGDATMARKTHFTLVTSEVEVGQIFFACREVLLKLTVLRGSLAFFSQNIANGTFIPSQVKDIGIREIRTFKNFSDGFVCRGTHLVS